MAYKKLDPEFKSKWVRALRSGRYKQTSQTLRGDADSGFGYCCLGVACNIVNPKKWKPSKDNGPGVYDWGDHPETTVKGFPFISDGAAKVLANQNDTGDSFAEIAAWIDKYL